MAFDYNRGRGKNNPEKLCDQMLKNRINLTSQESLKKFEKTSKKVFTVLKAQKMAFEAGKIEEEDKDQAIKNTSKVNLTPDLLERSQHYRNNIELLFNCQLVQSLILIRQPLAATQNDDLIVVSKDDKTLFEPDYYHRLLSPHSKGIGQQSGYEAEGSDKTAQEYVGLFTTLSHLRKWKNKMEM